MFRMHYVASATIPLVFHKVWVLNSCIFNQKGYRKDAAPTERLGVLNIPIAVPHPLHLGLGLYHKACGYILALLDISIDGQLL